MRIPVLGLGRVGSAMAQRGPAFGLERVLWNCTRGPAEAACGADLLLGSLTNADAAREVYRARCWSAL